MAAACFRFPIYDLPARPVGGRFTVFKLFLLLTISFLLLTIPGAAHAQAPSSPAPASDLRPLTSQSPSYDLRYLTSGTSPHTASLAIYNFSHAMSCILIGQSPIAPCLEYKMVKDATGMVKSVPYLNSTNTSNGVLGMSLSMIGEVISTPPIHSSLFLANLGEQIGIKQAHAQVGGSGSGVLAPIFKLWEVSRNISYLAMIVIFIGVGFMVMFRQKLNPQTVVSVQLALPGLVIGLVMITFSYFLASLISDLAFVGTNVVGYYFASAQTNFPIPSPPLLERISNLNVLKIFGQFVGIITSSQASSALGEVILVLTPEVKDALALFGSLIVFQLTSPIGNAIPVIGQFIAPVVGGIASIKASADLQGTWGWIMSWIASFILIYSMLRLLFRLVNNFLSIVFLTISSPFQFLISALPGRQGLVIDWIRNMLCNVLAFPAIIAVFYFVAFLLGNSYGPLIVSSKFSVTGDNLFPLLGGMRLDFLNLLLAFGALVATPSIPDLICKFIGKPGQAGQITNQAIMANIGAGRNYAQQQFGRIGGPISSGRQAFAGDRQLVWTPSGYQTAIQKPGIIDMAVQKWPKLNPRNWRRAGRGGRRA